MRRLQKVLLGALGGGVLLCGIGTGVAITEFSSLSYAGERTVGETDMETATLEAEIDPEAGTWALSENLPWGGETEFAADESVPENTVRFQVVYNAKRITPKVQAAVYTEEYVDENGDYQEKEWPVLELYGIWEEQDEVKLFMEVKDIFLEELKEGKISSYQEPAYVEQVKVFYNPANEADLEKY